MKHKPYEEIEHTADWALSVRGRSLEALFEHAAQGMFSLLNPSYKLDNGDERSLKLTAMDLETLLVTWLEELLYQLESENRAAEHFQLEIRNQSLKATYRSFPIQTIKKDIKAVTYNELEIDHDADGFHTTIVFDV